MHYLLRAIHIYLLFLCLLAVLSVMNYNRTKNFHSQILTVRMEKKLQGEVARQDEFPVQRVCGSPAAEGYAKIDFECLAQSPTTAAYLLFLNKYMRRGAAPSWISVVMDKTDLDGVAVQWGIGNKKTSAKECEQACIEHKPRPLGLVSETDYKPLPCNAWVWCPHNVCWEPDAHLHTKGDCWLKFTEVPNMPEVNMQGNIPSSVKSKHVEAPEIVPWISGVLLLPGMRMTNGTWSPRASW